MMSQHKRGGQLSQIYRATDERERERLIERDREGRVEAEVEGKESESRFFLGSLRVAQAVAALRFPVPPKIDK